MQKPITLAQLRTLVKSAIKVQDEHDAPPVAAPKKSDDKEVNEWNDIADTLKQPTRSSRGRNPSSGSLKAEKTIQSDKIDKPEPIEKSDKLDKIEVVDSPSGSLKKDSSVPRIMGSSQQIEEARRLIRKLADSNVPVYISGESGSGKEQAARSIHELSNRYDKPFIAVNCGAIPENLMESEFFGYKKGSFTGADQDRLGFFQHAHGGTLFLDEVADLPLAMQVKLLRAIQEKKVRPIGGTQEIPVDIRLLSATHKDLAKLVEKGDFRQDLYYRINVIEVKLPSLNERKDDIPLLANHFLRLIAKDWGLENPVTLSDTAKQALLQHNYSGNVRELRNILERAITLSDGHLIEEHHLNLKNTANSETNLAINIEPPSPFVNHVDTQQNLTNTTLSNVINEPVIPITTKPIAPTQPAEPPKLQNEPTKNHGFFGYTTVVFGSQSNQNTSVSITPPKRAERIIQTLPPIIGKIMPSIAHQQDTQKEQSLANKLYPDGTGFDELPPEGLEEYLNEQERRLIVTALRQADGNKTNAAKKLGMSFRSFRYRMSKLGLDDE